MKSLDFTETWRHRVSGNNDAGFSSLYDAMSKKISWRGLEYQYCIAASCSPIV
jgi:hypothetical protein